MSSKSRRRKVEYEAPLEPVRINTSDVVEPEDREPIFYIDDKEYSIPKKVPADFTMRYLNNVRKSGVEFAIAEAMTDLIGEAAMEELADCPQMSNENLQNIMKIIERKMLIATETALGN